MAEAAASTATKLVSNDTFGIRVSNLSLNTSAETLAILFRMPVQFVLMDTMKNEAWIRNFFRKDMAETKANNMNGKQIDNQMIECQAMEEFIHIAKLCSFYRIGNCNYKSKCSSRHIDCNNPDNCSQNDCYYGHSKKRPAVQVAEINYDDPAIEYYRIKISGLPMGTTPRQLQNKLYDPKKGQYTVPSNQISTTASSGVTAYLRGQPSEIKARDLIKSWHQQDRFQGFPIKYQLEIDHNNIDGEMDVFLSALSKLPAKAGQPSFLSANVQDDDIDPCVFGQDTDSDSQLSQKENRQLKDGTLIEDEESVPDEVKINDSIFPPDLKKRKEWTYTGKPLCATDTGQGEVFRIRQISGTGEDAALKIYKRFKENTKRMRSYREMLALRTMGNENKQTVANVSLLIDTNISDDFNNHMKDREQPWIILKLADGCSLTEFIEKSTRKIGLREAIKFCIKLLNITRSFHACGVVHRDLKPDNIHINCSDNSSLDQGNITVLDFGLAYIEQTPLPGDNDLDKTDLVRSEDDFATNTGTEIGNRWYRVPQLTPQGTSNLTTMQKNETIQQRRSPSIDASSICAHLYWLLTKQVPGEEFAKHHEPPPHLKIMQKQRNIWDDIIQQAIKAGGSKYSEARLKRYLFDVFDRGFADATNQWTVDPLLCHLNIMCHCLDDGTMSSNQSSNSISDLIFSSTPTLFLDQFSPAAHIFERAKNYFVERSSSASTIYHWATKNKFRWVNELGGHQRTNVDLLHYCDRNFKMGATEIYCVAKIDEKMNINMFVGSVINGINIQLPVYTLTLEQRDNIFKSIIKEGTMGSFHNPELQDPINKIFAEELRTLVDASRPKETQ